ncbi:SWI2/SNF2-containing protein RAD26 [Besnoitia besnoiti]|uniref:SWI2/SNF2-containing protein RAD26 n=1 Tax=Besnoitia besnoiti TaxID=94643 RepID=A0A2A9MIN2_BESBE|nr:SWI2/SNF2-containing protein RAD26 [Besnoitia besnoiti]PFH37769.1 SWI2/SNF2-containing protein RAD26 [Besnoitia besnoiti]
MEPAERDTSNKGSASAARGTVNSSVHATRQGECAAPPAAEAAGAAASHIACEGELRRAPGDSSSSAFASHSQSTSVDRASERGKDMLPCPAAAAHENADFPHLSTIRERQGNSFAEPARAHGAGVCTLSEKSPPAPALSPGESTTEEEASFSTGNAGSSLASMASDPGSGQDSSLSSSLLQRLGVRTVSAAAVEERVQEELQQRDEELNKRQRKAPPPSASSASSSFFAAVPPSSASQPSPGRNEGLASPGASAAGAGACAHATASSTPAKDAEGRHRPPVAAPGYHVENRSASGLDELVRGLAARLESAETAAEAGPALTAPEGSRSRGAASKNELPPCAGASELPRRSREAEDLGRGLRGDTHAEEAVQRAGGRAAEARAEASEDAAQTRGERVSGELHTLSGGKSVAFHGETEKEAGDREEEDREEGESEEEYGSEEDESVDAEDADDWTPASEQKPRACRGGATRGGQPRSRKGFSAASDFPSGLGSRSKRRRSLSVTEPPSDHRGPAAPEDAAFLEPSATASSAKRRLHAPGGAEGRLEAAESGGKQVEREVQSRGQLWSVSGESGADDDSSFEEEEEDRQDEEDEVFSEEEERLPPCFSRARGKLRRVGEALSSVEPPSPTPRRRALPGRPFVASLSASPSRAWAGWRGERPSLDDSALRLYRRRLALYEESQRESGSVPSREGDVEISAEPEAPGDSDDDAEAGRGGATRPLEEARLKVPGYIWENLYPYQQEGVRWLWRLLQQGVGGIIGDEMGLGKTIQTVAFLASLHHSGVLQGLWEFQRQAMARAAYAAADAAVKGRASADRRNAGGGVIIVCPATVLHQWAKELHLWYPPLRVCVFHQKSVERLEEAARGADESHGVLLTTYETLRTHLRLLLRHAWKMVILDEGQKIRNPHAAITLAVKQLPTPHRLILSATPIQNNLQEFWSLLDFAAPGRLGTLPVFLEQIAEPITMGGYANASRDHVEAAYRCACLLRKVALPLILRRSKKEMQEFLQLPNKAEEVLLCHMTPEQYTLYTEFLSAQKARFSRNHYHPNDDYASPFPASDETLERRERCRTLFALSVLRKIANHPDLLLVHNEVRPHDYGNPDRAGKLTVLREVLRVWKAEGRRVLLFAQTVQMLDIVQNFLETAESSSPSPSSPSSSSSAGAKGYSFLRLDGRVSVASRHSIVDRFQQDASIFVLLLTTRVGGVGLNLTAADRVVIIDPDWNPMTDMQARERSWRIGQDKDVCVYRLIAAGTVEEKIYHRQVFKFFLSQKVLQDPRQRKFFKRNDLQEMLEPPPPPPGFNPDSIAPSGAGGNSRYRDLLHAGIRREQQAARKAFGGEREEEAEKRKKKRKFYGDEIDAQDEENETVRTFKQAAAEGASDGRDLRGGEALTRENNLILKTLLDAKGIQTSLAQDDLERPLLDASFVDRQSRDIARAAMRALRASQIERMSHGIEVPTWTGKRGRAGIPSAAWRAEAAAPRSSPFSSSASSTRAEFSSGMASSILAGLRRLQQSLRPPKESLSQISRRGDGTRGRGRARGEADVDADICLTFEEKKLAEDLLSFFLSRADSHYSVTTGELLEVFAPRVPEFRRKLFRAILKELCEIVRSSDAANQPSYWVLRAAFRNPEAA